MQHYISCLTYNGHHELLKRLTTSAVAGHQYELDDYIRDLRVASGHLSRVADISTEWLADGKQKQLLVDISAEVDSMTAFVVDKAFQVCAFDTYQVEPLYQSAEQLVSTMELLQSEIDSLLAPWMHISTKVVNAALVKNSKLLNAQMCCLKEHRSALVDLVCLSVEGDKTRYYDNGRCGGECLKPYLEDVDSLTEEMNSVSLHVSHGDGRGCGASGDVTDSMFNECIHKPQLERAARDWGLSVFCLTSAIDLLTDVFYDDTDARDQRQTLAVATSQLKSHLTDAFKNHELLPAAECIIADLDRLSAQTVSGDQSPSMSTSALCPPVEQLYLTYKNKLWLWHWYNKLSEGDNLLKSVSVPPIISTSDAKLITDVASTQNNTGSKTDEMTAINETTLENHRTDRIGRSTNLSKLSLKSAESKAISLSDILKGPKVKHLTPDKPSAVSGFKTTWNKLYAQRNPAAALRVDGDNLFVKLVREIQIPLRDIMGEDVKRPLVSRKSTDVLINFKIKHPSRDELMKMMEVVKEKTMKLASLADILVKSSVTQRASEDLSAAIGHLQSVVKQLEILVGVKAAFYTNGDSTIISAGNAVIDALNRLITSSRTVCIQGIQPANDVATTPMASEVFKMADKWKLQLDFEHAGTINESNNVNELGLRRQIPNIPQSTRTPA